MGAPVIAHGDAPPVLESAEHIFDFMALFVELLAVEAFFPAVFARRDAGLDAFSFQRRNELAGAQVQQNRPSCIVANSMEL